MIIYHNPLKKSVIANITKIYFISNPGMNSMEAEKND